MKAGWLTIIERFPSARLIWDVAGPNGSELRAYGIGGVVLIVHDYAHGDGWQAYVPVTPSPEIADTLDAIADWRTNGGR